MKIVVLKFGGTSVGTVERIKKVANIITLYIRKKYKVFFIKQYQISDETKFRWCLFAFI